MSRLDSSSSFFQFSASFKIISRGWDVNKKLSTAAVCVDPCLWKAGINGSWVQDFEFAENYGQYPTPLVIPQGPYFRRTAGAFIPSEDAPFPWRTSWKWVDHECSVDVMTYDGICRILDACAPYCKLTRHTCNSEILACIPYGETSTRKSIHLE